MPRWPSVLTAAAAALVAVPIGGHYLAPKDTNTSAITEPSGTGRGAFVSRGPRVASTPSQHDTKTLAQTRRDGEDAAVEEGTEDITSLMCAYTQQAPDNKGGCPDTIPDAKVIIATVPDPVHTHMALRFDREIDTLEDALQQLGWVYDRSWLPWDDTVRKAPDRWDARTFDNAEQDALETLPGVLLFHHTMDAYRSQPLNRAVVVLLVAEKPTGGVNAEQFQQAIEFWQKPWSMFGSQRSASGSTPRELSILGPTFSGSLPSLHRLLTRNFPSDAPGCPPLSITISSGSVSDGDGLQAISRIRPCGENAGGHVSATSFFPNARERERQLLCFISDHHASATVAQISEKESTYGSLTNESAGTPGADHTRSPSLCASQSNAGDLQVLHLPFPREISQLRKAYSKSGIVGFSDTSDAPRTELQLSTAEDEHEGDTIPGFAGQTGTVAMEAQMASIARALALNHASIAVISATDVMDEIFVAQYLSQHSPNVAVIIQDSDQLFLHSEANSSLSNVYVASPWPLSEESEQWTRDANGDTNSTLPSASDQGVFLAMHTLICKGQSIPGCRVNLPGSHPFIEENTNGDWTPPLWLSVVEHGHFLPVALLPSTPAEWKLPETFVAATASYGISETRTNNASKLLATFIILLLLWHAWACSRCSITRSFAWTYAEADQEHHRLRLLVKAALALIGAYALAYLYVASGPLIHVQHLFFWMYLALGQAVGIYASSRSIYRLLVGEGFSRAKLGAALYAAVCTIAFATLDFFHWLLLAPFNPGERTLFLYRASLPLSGASPTLPLLFLVAAFAAILHGMFARMAFFGHRIPKLPAGFDELRCPSPTFVKDLTNLLSTWKLQPREWRLREWAFPLSGILMAGLFLIPEQHSVKSLAHGNFDRLMTFFAVLGGTFILQNLAVAAHAWRLLKHKLLIPLKQSPLRWGFTWIKGFSWRRIWTSSRNLSSNQIFSYLIRLLQTSSRSPWGGKNPGYYDPIEQLYIRAEQPNALVKDFTDGMTKLHDQMQSEAEGKLRDLQYRWQKDRGPITGPCENRGIPHLYEIGHLEGSEREDILRRMGDEEFVALLYLGYITMILIQIRQRILTAALLFILLLLSLTSYPWMYRQTILLIMISLFVALAGTTLHIYTEMHRDDILSRATETEPGKLDSGFFVKVVPVLGLPLLTLIASQFPEVSNFLFSWVQPGLSKF